VKRMLPTAPPLDPEGPAAPDADADNNDDISGDEGVPEIFASGHNWALDGPMLDRFAPIATAPPPPPPSYACIIPRGGTVFPRVRAPPEDLQEIAPFLLRLGMGRAPDAARRPFTRPSTAQTDGDWVALGYSEPPDDALSSLTAAYMTQVTTGWPPGPAAVRQPCFDPHGDLDRLGLDESLVAVTLEALAITTHYFPATQDPVAQTFADNTPQSSAPDGQPTPTHHRTPETTARASPVIAAAKLSDPEKAGPVPQAPARLRRPATAAPARPGRWAVIDYESEEDDT